MSRMLQTERVRLTDWHKGIREIVKQLDRTNIKILSAMWKYGPRNLLEVSRRTGIPFTSVYHRVAKLETKSKRLVSLVPQVSKLGLARIIVLATSNLGSEDKVTLAFKVPNYWRSVSRCEGTFTHSSIQLVPANSMTQFKRYVKRLAELHLTTHSTILQTGEYIPNFPNFNYYNAATNEWTFQWGRWLASLKKIPSAMLEDPSGYAIHADKKDMLIVRELQKNARRSFAELAPLLGISLQGVKYHFDKKLVPSGIVRYFNFDVLPYPQELSAYHQIILRFSNAKNMNRFYSTMGEMFFVLGVAKVLRQNTLIVETYTLQTQVRSLFNFLSEMAREGILESYSAVRQDLVERQPQTIPYELFDQERGWDFDLRKNLSELSKLARARTVGKLVRR